MKLRASEINLLKELLLESEKIDLTLQQLIDKNREKELVKLLMRKRKSYHEMMDEIRDVLIEGSVVPNQMNVFRERLNRLEIDINTLLDCSTGKIASVAILQKTKKLSNLWRAMHQYESVRPFALEIAEEMVVFEEESIKELREFL